jgi:hypothetical protein
MYKLGLFGISWGVTMTLEWFQGFLGWCVIINIGIMLGWFLCVMLAREWLYKIHRRFFGLPEQRLNTLLYTGLMFYKIGVWMFFIVPYIALRIAL